jgi:hypothetical protein
MSGKPLTFENIAWAIRVASAGRETEGVIARRMTRGISSVRKLLAELTAGGFVRPVEIDGQTLFEVVPLRERGNAKASFELDEDDGVAAAERKRAEAMWKERMGSRRLTSLKLKPGPVEFYRSPPAFGDRTLAGVCCEWG